MSGQVWFDTHCHLDVEPLVDDLSGVLERAWAAGVGRILVPAIHGPVADRGFPPWVARAWGIHPGICTEIAPEAVAARFARRDYEPCAIGETGLDPLAEPPLDHQEQVFRAHLALARAHGLPLILHVRGAWDRTLAILREEARGLPWIMHSFCGSWEVAQGFLREGAFLSFSGSLCRPTARKTPRVARAVPAERMLLETDAPDLAPPWWPTRDNEPAALPSIGRFLAELRGMPVEPLADLVATTVKAIWPEWEAGRR